VRAVAPRGAIPQVAFRGDISYGRVAHLNKFLALNNKTDAVHE
jgi:hypothetical protein